ncbi:hypothetical protein AB6D16_014820 [Vibrio cyclitrophicus]
MRKKKWPNDNEIDYCHKDLYWESDEKIKLVKYIVLVVFYTFTEFFFFSKKFSSNNVLWSDSNSPSSLRVDKKVAENNSVVVLTRLPRKLGYCVAFNSSGFLFKKQFYSTIVDAAKKHESLLERVASVYNIILFYKISSVFSKDIRYRLFLSHTSTSISSIIYNKLSNVKIFAVQHGNPSDAFFPSPTHTYLVFDSYYEKILKSHYNGDVIVSGVPWNIKFPSETSEVITNRDSVFLSQLFSTEINYYEHLKALSVFVKYCQLNDFNPLVKPHPKDNIELLIFLGGILGFKVLSDASLSECVNAECSFSMYSTALYELKYNKQRVGQIIPYSGYQEAFCFCDKVYHVGGWSESVVELGDDTFSFDTVLEEIINDESTLDITT